MNSSLELPVPLQPGTCCLLRVDQESESRLAFRMIRDRHRPSRQFQEQTDDELERYAIIFAMLAL